MATPKCDYEMFLKPDGRPHFCDEPAPHCVEGVQYFCDAHNPNEGNP